VNPFLELRGLLGKDQSAATVGRVIAVSAEAVDAQTASGRVRASRPTALTISVGDEVLIENGAVRGRLRAAVSVPVYRL
jgi:hypothetical protein